MTKFKSLSQVPEDLGLTRCRVPNQLFQLQTLTINQWVHVISKAGISYSRSWPYLKNVPGMTFNFFWILIFPGLAIVQFGCLITRDPESKSEVDLVASLANDECMNLP